MTGATEPGIVMCGCHEYGQHLLARLLEAGLRIAQFVVLTPEQGRRYGVSGYCDLRPLAERHGIPVYVPRRYGLDAPEDVAFFRAHRFDLLIQGGWQRLFPAHVLQSLRLGAIGVHGSADFLPKGRGRSPLNWALINGDTRFILQLFLIQAGVDDGPVFDWEMFDITPFDDIRTLYYKNVILTDRMIRRSIPRLLDGRAILRPQAGEPTHYPKREPKDGAIDWQSMAVGEIHDLVRALTRPYPGAFGLIDGRSHRIWRAQVFDTRITYPDRDYGAVVERFDGRLVLNCRGGLLLVQECESLEPEAGA